MEDQPELNKYEEELLKGFSQALDYARLTYPDYLFRIERNWDAPYARYMFLFVIGFPKENKEKYIEMFAHTNSMYTWSVYRDYIHRALIHEFASE